ncbi:MAG: DotA/TraY family protein, partial [Gammaproteobacteria bacterium]
MFRSLLLIITLLFSGLSVASSDVSIAEIFTPTDNDYSLYIISKIFGDVEQSVLPGEAAATGPQLMGNLFRVFNIVTLALGVIMVIYTLVLAVLHTAHHGKMMGEKMSSMWVPIRIAFAIAMLVPKANGYCLAQVAVMWLVYQGVGAADTLWNTAVDYFEDGGSLGIGGQAISDDIIVNGLDGVNKNLLVLPQPNNTNKSLNAHASDVLRAATCVSAHNNNQSLSGIPYEIYTKIEGNNHYLQFGRRLTDESTATSSQDGYECGRMKFTIFNDMFGTDQELANVANAKQMSIVYAFAQTVQAIGERIATGHLVADPNLLQPEYNMLHTASVSYVTTMLSNQSYFTKPEAQEGTAYDFMRSQGWITAGNYYQVLAGIDSNYEFQPNADNTPVMTDTETSAEREASEEELLTASAVLQYYSNYVFETGDFQSGLSPADQMEQSIRDGYGESAEIFTDIGMSEAVAGQMGKFMDMISGVESTDQAKDPMIRLAKFGQGMMNESAKLLIGLAVSIPLLGFMMGWCNASASLGTGFMGMLAAVMPFIYGLASFMYMQGTVFGVYMPLIPFIIFATGAIGWIFAVVESMIAAPLIALGMTMPEGHEIYGKADSAIMLLLNMFMRPSLMVMGFVASILVTWLAIELVNVSFYSAIQFGGIIPDKFIGPFVVTFMYMSIVVTIVTKVFGLINHVPDKVLRWIGDNSHFQGSAMEDAALGAGKQGGQD